MKAITLWQPWASLWVAGIKKNETRSWATSHRGQLVVHAAKLSWVELLRLIGPEIEPLDRLCREHGLGPDCKLPRGCIVGGVDVEDCQQVLAIEGLADEPLTYLGNAGEGYRRTELTELELSVGDYSHGRYAWIGARHKTLTEPIPCHGRQGLWTVSSVEAAVLAGEGMVDHV